MRINVNSNPVPNNVALVLIIGLPGSGKSTTANLLSSGGEFIHVEADQYFIDNDTGEYVFDADKLSEAHEWCLNHAKELLESGYKVVVSNTLTTAKERRPYFELGFKFAVHIALGNYQDIHNTPDVIVTKMTHRWEPYLEDEFSTHTGFKKKTALDLRVNWPITVTWGKLPGDYQTPIFFDRRLKIIEAFTRYCLNIADLNMRFKAGGQAHKSRIDSVYSALKSLAEYLRKERLIWQDLNDYHFDQYREWELERLKRKKQTKTNLTRKRTVNNKLQEIYRFYTWAQEEAFLIENHIGWGVDVLIRSQLPNHQKDPSILIKDYNKNSLLFPKQFTRVGGASRGNIGHVATNDEVNRLRQYFREKSDPYAIERNILITDLAEAVGWRKGSINSLLTTQFSDELIESVDGEYLIVMPIDQKFGYEKEFDVPLALALRINNHINNARASRLEDIGVDETVAQHSLFISTIEGTPLESQTIVSLFGTAFKALGCPKGSGIHSLRRKFTNDEIAIEIKARIDHKLPTDPDSVLLPVSKKLGQNNLLSPQFYSDASASLTNESPARKQKLENLKLRSDLAEKDREIARLNILLLEYQ